MALKALLYLVIPVGDQGFFRLTTDVPSESYATVAFTDGHAPIGALIYEYIPIKKGAIIVTAELRTQLLQHAIKLMGGLEQGPDPRRTGKQLLTFYGNNIIGVQRSYMAGSSAPEPAA